MRYITREYNTYVRSIPNNTRSLAILINRSPIPIPALLTRAKDRIRVQESEKSESLSSAGCFDGRRARNTHRGRETPGVRFRNGFFFPRERHLSNYSEIKKPTPAAVERGRDKKRRGGVGRGGDGERASRGKESSGKKGRRTFAREM